MSNHPIYGNRNDLPRCSQKPRLEPGSRLAIREASTNMKKGAFCTKACQELNGGSRMFKIPCIRMISPLGRNYFDVAVFSDEEDSENL